ncbi:MAG: cobalamin-dependent protein [Methanomassiliicoccales archaeon]
MPAASQEHYALIDRMAYRAIDEHRRMRPALFASYRGVDNEHCIRDTQYHFRFLFDAVSLDSPELFVNYVAWCRVLLNHLGITPEIFLENLQFMQKEVHRELRQPLAAQIDKTLQMALDQFHEMSDEIPPFVDRRTKGGIVAQEYLDAVLRSDRTGAQAIIRKAKAEGLETRDIYLDVFQVVQYELGRLWQHRQVSVAQEHYATAVSQQLMAQMYPEILTAGAKKGKVVVACVGDELHEMGARMVSDFLEMEGWDVSYLGSNSPVSALVAYLKQVGADLLMASVTMGYNVKGVRELIKTIRADPELKKVKIIVGGHPFNESPGLWKLVGADGFARDAEQAIVLVNDLLGGR